MRTLLATALLALGCATVPTAATRRQIAGELEGCAEDELWGADAKRVTPYRLHGAR